MPQYQHMDQPTDKPATSHDSMGTIVGGIVIIGAMLLVALYVWGAKIEKERRAELNVESQIDPYSPESLEQ